MGYYAWLYERKKKKVQRCIAYFLAGKYNRAKRICQDMKNPIEGDILAVKALMAEPERGELAQNRELYCQLWDAKIRSVKNVELSRVVDAKLAEITPAVLAYAKEDIQKMHKHYLAGEKEALYRLCKEHVAYGHPDAVALNIWGCMKLGPMEHSKEYYMMHLGSAQYKDFKYELETAISKGLSEEFQEHSQTLIQELDRLIELLGDGIVTDPVPPPRNEDWFGWY